MRLEVIRDPSLEEALSFIREALRKKEYLVVFGECTVEYEGRGFSRLTSGERMFVVKQDGAVLLHRPEGYSPVNWQPSTASIEARILHSGELLIVAIRSKPREILRVYFKSIGAAIKGKLTDTGEFVMYLSEAEIRDMIYEDPGLIEEGLRITEKEKPIDIGYIDLFGYDSSGRPVIIELKRVPASREAVMQLYNYIVHYKKKYGITPRGILVAPSFYRSAIDTAEKLGIEWKEINIQKLWKKKKSIEKKEMNTLDRFFKR